MLKGETIKLYKRTQNGVDGFNRPVYTETVEYVDNVLIGQPEAREVLTTLQIYGKKAVFTLGIPKGDTHNWDDVVVEFYGQKWKTFGFEQTGNQALIPLAWGKNVKVERYG